MKTIGRFYMCHMISTIFQLRMVWLDDWMNGGGLGVMVVTLPWVSCPAGNEMKWGGFHNGWTSYRSSMWIDT